MEIDINTLLKGQATKIKDKTFFPTRAYVEPFLERMSKYTNNFRVQVKLPDQITTVDNTDNITYNRVSVEAILPKDYDFEGHVQVFGLVYGIDTRKPVAKLFKAAERSVCTNLCVFNPEMIDVQELQPETPINFKPLKRIAETTDDIVMYLKQLVSTTFDCSDETVINEQLGKWIRGCMYNYYDSGFGKVKLATSTAIDAYKLLFEKEDSDYFVGDEKSTTMFNVYNAFTQTITDNRSKEIMNNCEKTLLLKDILRFG